MAYTEKFQTMSDRAMARVDAVAPSQVDILVAAGAILLDIRDKEEHDKSNIPGSVNVSRGKLEMNIEGFIPDLNATIICYCNANNRGALSAAALLDMGYDNAMYISGGRMAYHALTKNHKSVWDQRYTNKDYIFGTEPNEFLQNNVTLLPKTKVLCLADGEGRNSVYLASLGYDVTAVDSSKVGLEKAQQLASANGVTITTVHADLADYDLGTEQWHGIVSIFCHLPPQVRLQLHGKIYPALVTGGVLLLEAYTPKQLELKTGGPPVAAFTMQSTQLIAELSPLRLDVNQEIIRDVHEGSGHTGKGAVVQVIGVR